MGAPFLSWSMILGSTYSRSPLHAFGSRAYPYGYGLYSGPSQAVVHSVSVQTRLPSAAQSCWARGNLNMTSGRWPFLFGYSYSSMQNRLWTSLPTHFDGCSNSSQIVLSFHLAYQLFLQES